MKYPVLEQFLSIQGEGVHLGRDAYFIRLYGCPVRCPWCDTPESWRPPRKEMVKEVDEHELAEQIGQIRPTPALVVLTGGEPALYDLKPLVSRLRDFVTCVCIETSGCLPLRGDFDWVTVSPKLKMPPRPDVLRRAGEVKIIVEKPADISAHLELIQDHIRPSTMVWLHPEWSHREDKAVLDAILVAVRHGHGFLRAGWQVHKLYSAK